MASVSKWWVPFLCSKMGMDEMFKFDIREISKEDALKMIQKYHYSNSTAFKSTKEQRKVIWKEGLMEQNIAFKRCVDFLACMIEKYGQELLDEINAKAGVEAETKTEDTKSA